MFDTGIYTEGNIYNQLNLYRGVEYETILRNAGLLIETSGVGLDRRHNYKYHDPKVELFALLVERTKELLTNVKRMLVNLEVEALRRREFSVVDAAQYSFTETWKEIVLYLLDELRAGLNPTSPPEVLQMPDPYFVDGAKDPDRCARLRELGRERGRGDRAVESGFVQFRLVEQNAARRWPEVH